MADPRFLMEELLKAASEEFGEQLDVDENAECIIERDDGQELAMRVCEEPAALQFFAPLGSPPNQDREAFFAFLLDLNLNHEITDGAAISGDDPAEYDPTKDAPGDQPTEGDDQSAPSSFV